MGERSQAEGNHLARYNRSPPHSHHNTYVQEYNDGGTRRWGDDAGTRGRGDAERGKTGETRETGEMGETGETGEIGEMGETG
ncbi:MAG: hypothetical protein SWY16_14680 [Cyanobacteriota bacterium]|nr:hypothetical protein [Cyanobacteriota bacterium]